MVLEGQQDTNYCATKCIYFSDQNARRILTAVYQNTLYSEYLPPVLGKKIMDKFKLNVNSKNYFKRTYVSSIALLLESDLWDPTLR